MGFRNFVAGHSLDDKLLLDPNPSYRYINVFQGHPEASDAQSLRSRADEAKGRKSSIFGTLSSIYSK